MSLSTTTDLIAAPGFQPPRRIEDLSECVFYHTMEVPGFGLQTGSWDLRGDAHEYLGNQDFTGKTVVDVGTASGFLAFEMEKLGAQVTALDRLLKVPLESMGLIPFADFEQRFGGTMEDAVRQRQEFHLKLQNGFWLSHRQLNSKVKLYCGTAYDCPPELGQFDIAFFGSILLHLRDPLLALSSFAKATREKIIITEAWENIGGYGEAPVMFLRPSIRDAGNPGTWWYLNPVVLQAYLEILGFCHFEINWHEAKWEPDNLMRKMFTIVGTR